MIKRFVVNALPALVFLAPVVACAPQNTTKINQIDEKSLNSGEKAMWITGKVVYNAFEGGFYGIVTDNGDKLLPLNLDQAFKVENSKVRIKGKFKKDVMTIYQWGKPFVISDIEMIAKGTSGQSSTM